MIRLLRKLVRAILMAAALCLVMFGALALLVDRQGTLDEARQSDTIVVLGAVVNKDGQPGPDLSSRTEHAVKLWQSGIASRIICTGGYHNEPLSAASVCKRYAVKLGVPADRLWLADGSQNTAEDVLAAAEIMRRNGWRSAVVVSHPLHVFRGLWLFRQTGLEAVGSPTNTATDRIDWTVRLGYATREAGAIVMTTLRGLGWLPSGWAVRLHEWSYNLTASPR
jgi:uncharacterized SAM-binding protein YcdF (DUF218 family)